MASTGSRSLLRPLFDAVRIATRPGSAGVFARLGALPRLARSSWRGEYRGTAPSTLLMLGLAVGYVLAPIDLVPEAFLALLGLVDDAVVVTWIAATFVNATEDFLTWEQVRAGVQDEPRIVDAEFA
ncbi:MAG: YkvA family protein [Beutenbergiaceae bacterium]